MAQVTVTINDRRYNIACDDGQEAHLARLGAYVDR
ncbi:MAG: cell division protein ZapA, partial [Rhodospirillales bacterium]